MAKNRNNKKKQKNVLAPMDLTSDQEAIDSPQAMDTKESTSVGGPHRKIKGLQMKRSKNVRKMKAIAKAIAKNEKKDEKILKNDSKTSRIQLAKKLYD